MKKIEKIRKCVRKTENLEIRRSILDRCSRKGSENVRLHDAGKFYLRYFCCYYICVLVSCSKNNAIDIGHLFDRIPLKIGVLLHTVKKSIISSTKYEY